jgi:hypothetical protein
MRIAFPALCACFLSLSALDQAPQTAEKGAQNSGEVKGVVTAATKDGVTVHGTVDGKIVTWTLKVEPDAKIVVVAPTGAGKSTSTIQYKDAMSGGLKKYDWLADGLVVGKAVDVSAKNGVAVEAKLFPMCTRERCESSSCKQKCKASACACPKG